MALTTEGLIAEISRFRNDKMALVALIGSMGNESADDALERLQHVRDTASAWLTEHRKHKKDDQYKDKRAAKVWADVYDLANEVEPWLAQVVARGT